MDYNTSLRKYIYVKYTYFLAVVCDKPLFLTKTVAIFFFFAVCFVKTYVVGTH